MNYLKRFNSIQEKFQVNIYLKQLTNYKPGVNDYIKIYIKRGNHKIETQKPVKIKKQCANFKNQKLKLECTMYYDKQQKKYLQKQTQLKIKQCDSKNNDSQTVATLVFDLAEYIEEQNSKFQIQFEFQEIPAKLSAQIEFIKKDNQSQKNSNQQKEKAKTDIAKNSEISDTYEKPKKNKRQQEANIQIPKKKQKKQDKLIQKKHQNEQIQNNQDHLITQKRKYDSSKQNIQENGKKKNQQIATKQIASTIKTTSIIKNTQNSYKNNQKFDQVLNQNNKQSSTLQLFKKKEKVKFNEPQKIINLQKQQQNSEKSIKKQKENEVKIRLLQKQVQQKQKELQSVKSQCRAYKDVIQKISSQPAVVPNPDSFSKLSKLQSQNRLLKQKIIEKQVNISDLQIKLNNSKQKQFNLQNKLKNKSAQFDKMKDELTNIKNKVAVLLMDCFEKNDNKLMAYIQKHFQLE